MKFHHTFEQKRDSGWVESNCNAITFVNKGDTDIKVSGFALANGEALELEGWPGEMDHTSYQVIIDPASVTPLVHIIRKIYQ
jgi:hypothetical protein